MGKMAIVVCGSFNVDLMARAGHLPMPGETVMGSMFRQSPGGKGFNQAVAAHLAGGDVTAVIKVGNDAMAGVALETMAALKMPPDMVLRTPDAPTGTALITVDEGTGQNTIVVTPGANDTFDEADLARIETKLRGADYLLLQMEINQEANEAVARMAKAAGVRVVVNHAPYRPVSDEFFRGTYLITPNELEAEALTGVAVKDAASAARAAAILREKGVEQVVITLGSRGVYVGEKDEILPANRVTAVDATGAGDAFNGGLVAALDEGKSLPEACKFANAVAALSVQRVGAAASMPTRAETDALLAAM